MSSIEHSLEEAGWSGELGAVTERIAGVATGRGGVHVMRGGYRVAMGLPKDRGAARVVLDFYHPHRVKGLVFRLAGRVLIALGLHRVVFPLLGRGSEHPDVDWLREPAAAGRVGFLGCNPSHGLRCVVGGVLEDGKPFVAKLGFDRSREAIVREAEVLKALNGSQPGVLKALSFEAGDDWAMLRLPHLGFQEPRDMEDPVVVELLNGWLGDECVALGSVSWAADLLEKSGRAGVSAEWCEAMRLREVRTALVHGDFAVWNLRILPEGPCAIDWEWAVEEGVGGIDLAYGLCQEALLLRKEGAAEAVQGMLAAANRGAWKDYLDRCGWGEAHEDWLILGLLHGCLNAGAESRPLLVEMGVTMEGGD